MTVFDALGELAARGINAVPVQTLRELADCDRAQQTGTVNFERRERDGWENECFAPSWFAFDGMPGARPAAAPAILAEWGYTATDVERLIASGVVGHTEWFPRGHPD